MGQRSIVITYRKAGTKPPVFVAGTFSDPAWQPYEMSVSSDASGELSFEKFVTVEAGTELQYKFRLGNGDWWVCDDSVTKATDHEGNVNNVLRISSLSIDESDFEIEDEESDDAGPPMFSHECFGSHDASPDAPVTPEEVLLSPKDRSFRLPNPVTTMSQFKSSGEDIDYDDPRLERFPHENRRSILAELQRIETSTAPDLSLPGGIAPVSPVFTASVVSPLNMYPEGGALEPEPLQRRSLGSRASLASYNSHLSLASINEIIEDEGDVSEAKQSFADAYSSPSGNFDTADHERAGRSQRSTSHLVCQEEPEVPIVRLEAPSDVEGDEGISLSTGNSISKSDAGNLRKREPKSPHDRPASPASTDSFHEVSKQDHWFRSFLRVVVVDWIGGFLSNLLFGSRRKA